MTTATVKRIVCLANSRRMSGRCIAGKELLPDGRPGPWLRPVSNREGEEVSERERQYADGSEPRLLDVVDIPALNAAPAAYQRENWRLDPARRWARAGNISQADLPAWVDPDAPLWTNGHSSSGGQNDRVPFDDARRLVDSLRLIRVDALQVSVLEPARPSANFPILRGRFRYNGDDYALRITDPESEAGALQLDYGDYPVQERYLTVSLAAHPYEGYIYKLIAAIIKP